MENNSIYFIKVYCCTTKQMTPPKTTMAVFFVNMENLL